jgi:hypothetical protein
MAALSPKTVRRLARLFQGDERAEAERLLVEKCGNKLAPFEAISATDLERFHFAALKLSGGQLDKLRAAVELAQVDWGTC